jgi:hypothetical protein
MPVVNLNSGRRYFGKILVEIGSNDENLYTCSMKPDAAFVVKIVIPSIHQIRFGNHVRSYMKVVKNFRIIATTSFTNRFHS